MSLDPFWTAVTDYLGRSKTVPDARSLIELTDRYWDRSSGDAFFAGSGGDEQLFGALSVNPAFTFDWIEADYHWSATDRDGDQIEYVEGDLYYRPAPPGFMCKRCGGPAPVGVGYVDTRPGAAQASEQVTTCQCGHSTNPGTTPQIAH